MRRGRFAFAAVCAIAACFAPATAALAAGPAGVLLPPPLDTPGLRATAPQAADRAVAGLLAGGGARFPLSLDVRKGTGGRLVVAVALHANPAGARRAVTRATRRGGSRVVAFAARRASAVVRFTPAGRDSADRRKSLAYAEVVRARIEHVLGQSAWERVLDEIGPRGQVRKGTALRALALVSARPVPGVLGPYGPRGVIYSGTLALRMALEHRDDLTSPQRRALERALRARLPARGALSIPSSPLAAAATLTPNPTFQAFANGFATKYAPLLGHPLRYPIRVFNTDEKLPFPADALPVNARGDFGVGPVGYCRVRLTPSFFSGAWDAQFQQLMLAHEVFHCFQGSMMTDYRGRSAWIIEGMADWAALTIYPVPQVKGGHHLRAYFSTPQTSLLSRAYDGVGFWGRSHEVVGSLWPRVPAILGTGNDAAAFAAAGGTSPAFAETWASSLFRSPPLGANWFQHQPYSISYAVHPRPTVPITGSGALAANDYANTLYEVHPSPSQPLIEALALRGSLRAGAPGLDRVVHDDFFCLGGKCECKAGEEGTVPPHTKVTAPVMFLGLGGNPSGGNARVRYHSLDEYCQKKKKKPKGPQKPGRGPHGPAESNGDPHLTSLDGLHFDFQAAGEFVLARSRSGDLEVQARQEPWEESRFVTLNTQVAMKVAGRRVTISKGEADPVVRVDGAVVDLAEGASRSLGAGSVRRSGGYTFVTWPDGSEAAVWAVGRWGVAMNLSLADERAGAVAGVLGDFDGSPGDDLTARAGKRVAYRAEDSSKWTLSPRSVPRFDDRERFFDQLYDLFGDSWRITQKASLLDYGPGQTTATFTDRKIPSRGIGVENFGADARRRAEQICREAGVTEPGRLEDCILDVIITGRAAFAESAADAEQAIGASWTRLRFGADRRGPLGFARTADGVLHLAALERAAGGAPPRIVATTIGADGVEGAIVPLSALDGSPNLVTTPTGGLRALVGSIELATGRDGIFSFTSAPPWAAWIEGAQVTDSGTAYADDATGVYAGGAFLAVSGTHGYTRVYREGALPNEGNLAVPDAAGCYSTTPSIAASGAEAWVAWVQWDCAEIGVHAGRIDAATGAVATGVLAPGSRWTTDTGPAYFDPRGQEQLALAGRTGGGVYLAYAQLVGARWRVLLWRVGGGAPLEVAKNLQDPRSVMLAADPASGRLWVAWEAAPGGLSLRRTNAAADGWDGAARALAQPEGPHPILFSPHHWDVLARAGGLDVLFGYDRGDDHAGALWLTSVEG